MAEGNEIELPIPVLELWTSLFYRHGKGLTFLGNKKTRNFTGAV
jgi:hypothetical protein